MIKCKGSNKGIHLQNTCSVEYVLYFVSYILPFIKELEL